MSNHDPNKTVIGGPNLDPNKTIAGAPPLDPNKTVIGGAPVSDPNKTTAWSKEEPLTFNLISSREATMANGPAREQFLLEINAPKGMGAPSGVVDFGARTPLNLCLVIDRSGSMEGTPLEYAKQACNQLVDQLSPNDVLSIVVFDEIVEVLMSPQRVSDKQSIKNGIAQLQPGYTTNLYDGINLAAQQLEVLKEGGKVTRMVVLTDGEPTAGIKEFHPLVQHAGDIKDKGITITFLGFGPEYNEELLASMAKKAGGNYYYIPSPELIPEIFKAELGKMLSTASTNLKLDVKPARWVNVKGCTGLSEIPDGDFSINLADVEQGSTIQVVLDLEFNNHPLGHYRVADGKIHYQNLDGVSKVVNVDFVIEFTADSARYSVPPHPAVESAAEVSAASRVVEKTIMGLKTMALSPNEALGELEKTQALLMKDGRTEDAQEVTLAMQAIKSGDIGGAEKTLMGTMVHLDQGKK